MPQIEVYHVDPANVDEATGTAFLSGDEANHLLRVRRANIGDEVMLIDGLGSAWPGELREADKKSATFILGEKVAQWREPGVKVHLGLALLKGDHWLEALDGSVQAGVHDVTPLITDRSIAGWKENKARRAQRRSLESTKQCGRGFVPPVHPEQHLAEWCIQMADVGTCFVAEPGGVPVPTLENSDEVVVAVGPEGGFTDDELALMEEHGFVRIDLGARRFRAEMAAIVTVARLIGPTETQ
jgi:16S rRNA (uracil1498-N3)-methyltransferase